MSEAQLNIRLDERLLDWLRSRKHKEPIVEAVHKALREYRARLEINEGAPPPQALDEPAAHVARPPRRQLTMRERAWCNAQADTPDERMALKIQLMETPTPAPDMVDDDPQEG